MKIIGIILAIVFFVLIVVIHEAGHLFAGKLCGVYVEEFSVGMGPLIFKKYIKETQYSIRAIPLGGYCKFMAEDGESDDPRAFSNALWWKKIIILVAGALGNFLACFIILFCVFVYIGTLSPVLSSVTEGSPADKAGLMAGDRIVAVDGVYYDEWYDIRNAIASGGDTLTIDYIRDRQEYSCEIESYYSEEAGRKIVGISASYVHSPGTAVKDTFETCIDYFGELVQFFKNLFTGKAKSEDVVGVVGMVSMVSEQATYGLVYVIYIMGLISLNLGAVNLLPFPALDGGRIVFVLLRKITHDKIGQKAETYVNAAGLIILMALMILLIFKDTINLFI